MIDPAIIHHPVKFEPKVEPFWPDALAILSILMIATGFVIAVKGI
jgi:hypothetical protein